MSEDKIYSLIFEIIELKEFERARYYALHLEKPLWSFFIRWEGIPFFLRNLCKKTKNLINKYEIKAESILEFYSITKDPDYHYVLYVLTSNKLICEEDKTELIEIEDDKLTCSLVSYIIDNNRISNINFNEIISSEEFAYEITDYKLTKVDNIEFLSNGYIFENKYYLYNIFIPRIKLSPTDMKPAIFKIIDEEALNPDLYLRIDERLGVPATENIKQISLTYEKFRGIQFNFNKTILERAKSIIVHGNINTLDKLLMVIKKDHDSILDEEFWHVEIEELPNLENSKSDIAIVTFIHGKYYPKRQSFRHIDYIKNQYSIENYIEKYKDYSNSDIKIDYYTEKSNHYKIWCIEEVDIKEETWYKLAYLSLRPVYRELFNEILGYDK